MSNIYTPYTYLIGWSKHKIWYYGVRFAKNCNPSDLWKPYKTSSKHVKNFIIENGDPDIIQIRKTFDNKESAQKWEERVLKRIKVVSRNDFLNKTDTNRIKTEAIANGLKKYWDSMTSEERKIKCKSWTDSLLAGRAKSGKCNDPKAISVWIKARWESMTLEERDLATSKWREGNTKYWSSLSTEEKQKRSQHAISFRKIVECPHCQKTGNTGNMNRWHFDNCKSKP